MIKSIAFILSEPGNRELIEQFDNELEMISDYNEYNSDNPGVITHYDIDAAEEYYNKNAEEGEEENFDNLRGWMKENGIDIII